MAERSPIFSPKVDGQRIGYIEGSEAFDLLGKKCCDYNVETGNLCDSYSGKIVGHVSLKGKFVGASSMAKELFLKSDGAAEQKILRTAGQPDTTAGRVVVGQQAARADGDQKSALFLKSDNDAAQKILRATGHLDATAGQVAEGQQQASAEGDAQKSALFLKSDNDAAQKILRTTGQLDATAGQVVAGQQQASAEGDAQKSAPFLKSDNDAAQKILRTTGHLDATAGQVAEGQQQAGAEGDAQKRAKAQTLRSLEEVLVVAREVFLPRSAEDPRTVPNIGEIPRSPPPEQSGPPIPTTSREHGGPFSEDVERIFEILRNRIGLSGS